MTEKNNLLSIGEISKLTGAGIKALRHYEKINILKPVYVDPFSGYRYYSFSQTYVVELIKFAVELDIPLKEFSEYVDEHGNMDFESFTMRGNEVVREKMKTLEQAIKFFDLFEEKLALQKEYPLNQIYTRKLPSKIFYTIPFDKSFENVDKHEVAKLFLEMPYDEAEEDGGWMEYGFLSEYSDKGITRYVFAEVPTGVPLDSTKFEHKVIPAGEYYCIQQDSNEIENVADIFTDYLDGNTAFLAIETEVFCGKFNINNPINELRVIAKKRKRLS